MWGCRYRDSTLTVDSNWALESIEGWIGLVMWTSSPQYTPSKVCDHSLLIISFPSLSYSSFRSKVPKTVYFSGSINCSSILSTFLLCWNCFLGLTFFFSLYLICIGSYSTVFLLFDSASHEGVYFLLYLHCSYYCPDNWDNHSALPTAIHPIWRASKVGTAGRAGFLWGWEWRGGWGRGVRRGGRWVGCFRGWACGGGWVGWFMMEGVRFGCGWGWGGWWTGWGGFTWGGRSACVAGGRDSWPGFVWRASVALPVRSL